MQHEENMMELIGTGIALAGWSIIMIILITSL